MCNSPNFRLKKVKLKELETYTPLPDIQFESVIHSVMSSCLRLHGLQPTRLLCPWDSPDKNTGVGSHSLLQGIFWTQGVKPCLLLHLLHCKQILYHLSHQGRPSSLQDCINIKVIVASRNVGLEKFNNTQHKISSG